MSIHYTHFLIPAFPDYHPSAESIAAFLDALVQREYVAANPVLSFSRVVKEGPRFRQLQNPFTRETMNIRLPSRRSEQPTMLPDTSQIPYLASSAPEYDASVTSEGLPRSVACEVGTFEDGQWKAFNGPRHTGISCRVRSCTVRPTSLDGEEDLDRPIDFATAVPRFGEDCADEEREGVFNHPMLGAIRVPNSRSARFWIEFHFGKNLFSCPRLGGVDVLDESITDLARSTFGVEFVQACECG